MEANLKAKSLSCKPHFLFFLESHLQLGREIFKQQVCITNKIPTNVTSVSLIIDSMQETFINAYIDLMSPFLI